MNERQKAVEAEERKFSDDKFCVDCPHFLEKENAVNPPFPPSYGNKEDICIRPDPTVPRDLVTGMKLYRTCKEERYPEIIFDRERFCGPEGKFYAGLLRSARKFYNG